MAVIVPSVLPTSNGEASGSPVPTRRRAVSGVSVGKVYRLPQMPPTSPTLSSTVSPDVTTTETPPQSHTVGTAEGQTALPIGESEALPLPPVSTSVDGGVDVPMQDEAEVESNGVAPQPDSTPDTAMPMQT